MSETKEKFSRYDVVDYLTDDESIAAFLEAVANEAGDDQVQIDQALEAVARARAANRLNRSL
jgi:DNA-binding phage protein